MPPAEELYAKVLTLEAENRHLQAQVAWFQRQVFAGGRSEKFVLDFSAQAELALEETARPEAKKRLVTYERRAPAREKRPMPAEVFAGLPVTETVEIVPEEVKAESAAFEKISEERTFEVDLIGPKLVKREIVRPKYRQKNARELPPLIAPAPARLVTGGYASAGLIAYIVVSKYQHHLPLYRLETMSAQWGAQLSRQSMVDWVRIAADCAEPIYK